MILRKRGMLLTGVVGAVTAIAGISGFAIASAAPQATVAAAQDDVAPPYAVEDFGYPGAERILAEKGISLRKGDGHILLAECSAANQIQVWTRQNKEGKYCFRVIGKTGSLTLEVKDVYAVQTEERAVRASLTADGKTTTVDVAKDDYRPVGEGTGGKPAVLIELKVTG